MSGFPFELVIPAFIAGLFTFLAPCTLPLVPGYLAYISGITSRELAQTEASASQRRRVLTHALLFVLGFTTIFIALGVAASRFGSTLIAYRNILLPIGGTFLVLFGLMLAGLLHLAPLVRVSTTPIASRFARGSAISAFIFGAAFAVGWSPCIGPVLGTVLTIAATKGSGAAGAILLGSFALGLAVPFLLIAYGIGSASQRITAYIDFTTKHRKEILGIMGLFSGFLLATILYAIPYVRFHAVGNVILISLPFILPLAGAWALIAFGMRRDTDAISFGGGITIVLLGVLLAIGKLGALISYVFLILGRFGLSALENALMQFL